MSDYRRTRLWFLLVAIVLWGAVVQLQISTFDLTRASHTEWYEARKPIIAVELATSGQIFQQVLDQGDESHNSRVLRVNTYLDFVFVALYWSLFYGFACLGEPKSKLVVIFASAAALLDVGENQRILACLSQLTETKTIQGLAPGPFGYTKWACFALALIFLGLYIKKLGQRHTRILVGVLLAAGVLTAVGLFVPLGMQAAALCFVVAILISLVVYLPFSMTAILQFIEYTYLLRFQIFFAFLLVAMLPALYWVAPSIFVGLFDARGFVSLIFVTWAAFQLAWTIMITSRLVLVYGPERFTTAGSTNVQRVGARTAILFGVLAVPFLATTWLGTLDRTLADKALAVGLGLIAAVIGLFLIAACQFAIEDDAGRTANLVFPSFGLLQKSKNKKDIWKFVDKYLSKLPPYLQAGIIERGQLRSGHQMAGVAVTLLGLIYVALAFSYRPDVVRPEKEPAAIFYLLFLLTLLTWLLAGAAFFLDRLRLPVFSSLLLLSILTGLGGTDHEFEVVNHPTGTTLSPDVVVKAWENRYRTQYRTDPKTVLVVATAGGGIRASAWTAQVLTGLQEDCGQRFGSSLLLVSSVSGGSVGSMFALSAFDSSSRSFPSKDTTLETVRFDAGRSSLASVGWGLLYPDLARTVPFLGAVFAPQTIDRGWALESAWISGWKHPPNMSDWRADVGHGLRPAVIFNATTSESGRRFIISSADLNPSNDPAVRFFRDYPDFDLPVVTAARLSASFPYVSPEGRASKGPEEIRYHVGDGGYYDNSGVLSALEWADAAKDDLKKYKVIFILIDSTPGSAKGASSWSWQRQLTGPVGTLLNVRSSSQTDRDHFELNQAERLLGVPVPFFYATKTTKCMPSPAKSPSIYLQPDESDPLSWHLNKIQACYVEQAWDQSDVVNSRKSICEALEVSNNTLK
jgi:hypothetical protein